MSSKHDLQRQAALWIRRLNDAGAASAAQADFIDWCKQSPSHISAMLELGGIREELRRLDEQPPAEDDVALAIRLLHNARHAATCNPVDSTARLPRRLSSARPKKSPGDTHQRTANMSRLLKITAATICVLMLTPLARSTLEARHPQYSTPAGESRRVILQDNTHVRLGPNTRMVVRFNRHQRLIEFSAGEAMFQVSPDPARAFLVRTDALTAHAVGTVFAVSQYQEDGVSVASVTVASGKVDVQVGHATAPTRLEDSEQAILRSGNALQTRRIDLRDELAWVDNRLVFYQGATLASAAQQFNRRNQLQIVITDPALAARPVMGTFRASDPQAFLTHFAPLVPFSIRFEHPDQARLIPL